MALRSRENKLEVMKFVNKVFEFVVLVVGMMDDVGNGEIVLVCVSVRRW